MAVACIWLLALLFFWPVVLGGETLYFRDTLVYYYPQAWLCAQAYKAGQLPLWEPLFGLGYPFHADPHGMMFYPPAALLLLVPFPLAYNLLVVLHVPLGGTFLYLLLRRWELSRTAALLAAVVFMFSGYGVSTVALTTLLKGAIWAPLAMLAFDAYLSGSGAWSVVATGAVLAIEGSGTDPQYVLFTAILVACTAALRPVPTRRTALQVAFGVVAAGALAGALLAYQYLPLIEAIGQSDRVGGLKPSEISAFPLEPLMLGTMVLPPAFASPAHPFYLLSFPKAVQPFYPDLYVGVPILSIAVASLSWLAHDGAGQRRTVLAAGTITVVGLALALDPAIGLHGWLLQVLPPLRSFRYPSKYFLFVNFGLAVLAGLGAHGLIAGRRGAVRAFSGALAAAVAGLAGLLWKLSAAGPGVAAQYLGAAPDAKVELEFGVLAARWSSLAWQVLAVAATLLVVTWLGRCGKLRPAVWLPALFLIAACDLCFTTRQGLLHVPAEIFSEPPPIVKFLRPDGPAAPRYAAYIEAPVRYSGSSALTMLGRDRQSHLLLRFPIGACYGLAPIFTSVSVRLAWESSLYEVLRGAPRPLATRLLAGLGVEYFVGLGITGLGPPVGRADSVVAERLPGALDRAFVARRAVPVSSMPTAITTADLLAFPGEARYHAAGATGAPTLEPVAIRRCVLTRHERHQLEVDVELEGAGLVVVQDLYYPGWIAEVDGQPRVIHRVGGVFRGVEVRTGERRLVMRYEPRPFRIGLAVTLATVTGILLALGVSRLRRPGRS